MTAGEQQANADVAAALEEARANAAEAVRASVEVAVEIAELLAKAPRRTQ